MVDYDTLLAHRKWFGWQKYYEEKAREPFSRYVEIGVWKGISIVFLAKELLKYRKPFELFAVDLWNDIQFHPEIHLTASDYEKQNIYEIYNYNLQKNEVRESIKDIQGFSNETASQFEDESVDFVFLDADHAHEAVKKDIQAWLPKVKQGGIIAGHDAKKVRRALAEVFGKKVKRYDGGVWEHRK